ncbi:FAD-binding oxidoreductase [Rhodococcus sp. 06-418-1B]|nr:FAD-linked oxidase C-terminal domain-containing protein [Rhodococcus sp. 06-418-1B]OZC93051.1 FAD-binding oxidoreductase [Rhodococcus sp. 06-418-1B]
MTAASASAVDELLSLFAQELGSDILITDPDIVTSYQRDQSRFTVNGTAVAVLAPRSVEQVSRCLSLSNEHAVTIVPRGAGSGLSGAANADDHSVILSLHRMNHIVEIDTGNRTVVVEPGVVTADLRAAAADKGLYYPPDPGSVEFCTIGGNIATNAGGMCCVKYGVTGDFVLGLQVVMADGQILRTGRKTVKGVAGYDLTSLFVGSEGTLGVVTEATLKLVPKPKAPQTLLASFPTLVAAGDAVSAIIEHGLTPSMLEILDRTTIRAVDEMTKMGLGSDVDALILIQSDDSDAADVLAKVESLCSAAGASDVVTSDNAEEGAMLLEARRMALPALERLGDWLLDDVCVPRTRIADLISSIQDVAERFSLTIGVFGHAGDGNLHPTIIFDESDDESRKAALAAFDAITQRALDLGGTITGEHGVGRLKKGWLATEIGSVGLHVQQSVKSALDPQGILNPTALFTGPAESVRILS